MSEDIQPTPENIELASKEGRVEDLSAMLRIPVPVLLGVQKMTRKERRQWYHENRKRLNLPKWGSLKTLEK